MQRERSWDEPTRHIFGFHAPRPLLFAWKASNISPRNDVKQPESNSTGRAIKPPRSCQAFQASSLAWYTSELHKIDRAGANLARMIHYPPLLDNEEKAVTLGEHSDVGSGSQLKGADITGRKYVKAQQDMEFVNLDEAVARSSNGKLVRRIRESQTTTAISKPPRDQRILRKVLHQVLVRPGDQACTLPTVLLWLFGTAQRACLVHTTGW